MDIIADGDGEGEYIQLINLCLTVHSSRVHKARRGKAKQDMKGMAEKGRSNCRVTQSPSHSVPNRSLSQAPHHPLLWILQGINMEDSHDAKARRSKDTKTLSIDQTKKFQASPVQAHPNSKQILYQTKLGSKTTNLGKPLRSISTLYRFLGNPRCLFDAGKSIHLLSTRALRVRWCTCGDPVIAGNRWGLKWIVGYLFVVHNRYVRRRTSLFSRHSNWINPSSLQ